MRTTSRPLLLVLVITIAASSLPAYGQPGVSLSPPTLSFATQTIGTQSAFQPIMLTNTGNSTLRISSVLVGGSFNGDFLQSSNCIGSLNAGSHCEIKVIFAPTGTGSRTASVLVFDDASNSPQSAALSGPGLGTITNIGSSAYQLLNARTSANQASFYVYQDQDSGFNHGFPSGEFGDLGSIASDAGCINNPADMATGCFMPGDTMHYDVTQGTVFRFTFTSPQELTGVNIEEPENWGVLSANHECQAQGGMYSCNGYDLRGATTVEFDVRSPDGATVYFGVGRCTLQNSTQLLPSFSFQHMSYPLSMFSECQFGPFDLANMNVLFGVQTTQSGTVLLDNIQFTPTPSRSGQMAGETLSLPFSTQSFGVVPQSAKPIPPDQNNRNMTTVYESALTMLALLHRGQQSDLANAKEIANALDYALFHDNHGDYTPQSPMMEQSGCYSRCTPATCSCGLHSAYEEGDIGLLNDQNTNGELGKAGDVRLAGFSVPQGSNLCGQTMFCLVQDGATGGNNAFAILALATAFQQTGIMTYLNDALIIGNWIVNLQDPNPNGYGGYFAGYFGYSDCPPPPAPCPKGTVNLGKSTENNADIFAAFSVLAQIEAALGNPGAAAQWTNDANVAGSFVLAMYDPVNNLFNAGTVPMNTMSGPGVCPNGPPRGNDVINTCPFLDAQSFPTLELAGSLMFGVPNPNSINWQLPTQTVFNYSTQTQNFGCQQEPLTFQNFTQSVTAGGINHSGFDLVPALPDAGIAWEFTGQMVSACMYLDLLYNTGSFQNCAATHQNQILQAANTAPFGDGVGVVAATVQDGDTLPPGMQYLSTPFQCIPERVGLAATNWAIFSDLGYDPLSFPSLTVSLSGTGGGTVASQDGFINCGTTCSYSYYSGSQAILTASPARGSFFSGWTGCDSQNGNTCMVTVVSSRSVTAEFSQSPVYYELSVSTLGHGSVASVDGLINCPGSCSHFYLANTGVTLNASPAQGWTFSGWSGACTGTGHCNLTMTQPYQVSGYFTAPVQFLAVTPCRLVDTRGDNDPIQGGTWRDFSIPQLGGCNIPSGAAAYSLNVTVVPHESLGYLTIWPAGEAQPVVSTMNSPDGRTKANAAIVPAGSQGAVSVYASNITDVILDIDGYFTTPGSETYQFYPLTPCRLVDTRGAVGDLGGPRLQAQAQRTFSLRESTTCIPTGLNPLAYSLNFTVIPNPSGQQLGYLSVWPAGDPQPVVSTLNNPTATDVANAAIVPAGANGDIEVYAYNTTDLLIDINGYFAAPGTGGLSLYPVAPCRVLDTRQSGGSFRGKKTVTVEGSACAPPSNAAAYIFNATVVPPGSMLYLTLWPDGEQQAGVSTLNAEDGFITSNMAIVPTTNGSIDAYAAALTQLILDISGFFAP